MKIVAVANQKGGVGKTGVTVGLAGCLVDEGYRVLVVDLEPQATSSEWLGALPPATKSALPEDTYGPVLLEALLNGKPLTPYETGTGIFLVPSGNELNSFDIHAARMESGQREYLLKRSLDQLPKLWDIVLIDCPPTLGLTTMNALVAAHSLLIPVKLDSASRTPLVRLFTAAEEVHRRFNPELDLIGVLGTFHERRRNHQGDVFDWLKDQFNIADQNLEEGEHPCVFPFPIRLSPHVSESHGAQLPVTHYLRQEGIKKSVAREDFETFTAEFIYRAQLTPSTAINLEKGSVVNG